ncbi:polymer-forming cytoskeletal protein [Pseudohongiella nitratireducens]|uniref:bactofilin family protein n=1 Tax=Pseudohongiella nitratireducens TaxID=1768907 RepID=UPI0030EC598E|tara:strand:+ start:5373 stop:5957 length:585 start_codon:yes stop_codon:yes gene_type:complete
MFDRNKDKPSVKPENSTPAHSSGASSTGHSTPSPTPAPTSSAPASVSSKSAVLGATIKVKGDISGEENLLIEGQVEGSVSLSSHELTIGKTGKLNANLTAKTIRIDGEVDGDITGKEKVVVTSTSQIKGNIVTPKMTLEEGARFKGTIDIDPAHANSSASPQPSASAATSSKSAANSSNTGSNSSSSGSGSSNS